MLFRLFLTKLKEAALSVVPITLVVFIISFTPLVNLEASALIIFGCCAVLLILGIALFSLGADLSMSPMGEHVGSGLGKTKKIFVMALILFILGFCITIAEPDLTVLGNQLGDLVPMIDIFGFKISIIVPLVGVGVGIFLVIAILKIILKKDLSFILMFFYMLAFTLAAILIETGHVNFLPVAFDSGGVTTGPITVPFIMALGIGVANTVGGRNRKENSFGLISLCSIGPIIVLLILGIFMKDGGINTEEILNEYSFADATNIGDFVNEFLVIFVANVVSVAVSLGLIVVFFLILNSFVLKLPKSRLFQLGLGIVITFFGLIIFLTVATFGYLPIGFDIGKQLANSDNKFVIVIFAFILGLLVVLAEPAVHVLTKQVEEVTTGSVSKMSMLISLSIGVGIALVLAIIRIIFNFSILYILVPGYLISLGLSFFVPKIYTAIAFDSGGVASGPLTSSFILPFAIGVCSILQPNSLIQDGFGVVALVAMTPLITIQILGFRSVVQKIITRRIRFKIIDQSSDDQIIDFME